MIKANEIKEKIWQRRLEPRVYRYLESKGVAMFHMGRCGSSVLSSLIDTHRSVRWEKEIFQKMPRTDKNEVRGIPFAKEVLQKRRKQCDTKYFGFETKFLPWMHIGPDFLDTNLPDYIELLKSLKFRKFIILQRKNHLRRLVSEEVGRKNKYWHTSTEVVKPTTIVIDPNHTKCGSGSMKLLDVLEICDRVSEELKNLLSGEDVLFMEYEEDVDQNPMIGYNKMCTFLNLPKDNPPIQLKKTNPFPTKEVLENFGEVSGVLKGTRWEWMLDG